MENKRGNEIFLGIVSVATLIVAIIGATFAYFSASTESNENAVNLGAYEFKLTLSVIPVFPEGATSLIPLEARKELELLDSTKTTYLEYAIKQANKCIDSNGLQVCALYKVIIYNQGSNDVTLTGKIRTVTNTPGAGENASGFLNLTYQAVNGTPDEDNLSLDGDPVKLNQTVDGETDIESVDIKGATVGEDGKIVPGEGVSYILVYLNENGDQSSEMGAKYTGQLIYTSGDGTGNNLTGEFNLAGPSEPTE